MKITEKLEETLQNKYHKNAAECTDAEIYYTLLEVTKQVMKETPAITGPKKVYYISAEFLIGRLLTNNLINLGVYDECSQFLQNHGKSLAAIEEVEPEPSLGNGGLGRLAACFLDSIATLGLPGEGIGLNYHYGLFKQVFEDHLQKETKNDWIEEEGWLTKTDVTFDVAFGDRKVKSRLYDIDVVGYQNGINKLRLFDIETIDESIVKDGIDFDKENIEKNLTLFLYPDDSDEAGRLLRVYQQYFMVSNGAQLILKEMKENGYDIHKLYEHAVIQINDTHPTMVIPELIRLLQLEGIKMEEAIDIVTKTCAYTNHTILAEALEKWPVAYLEKAVPQLMPIIRELDKRVSEKYKDERVQIIDKENRVHMAHIDIHYGFSVNGVAALHTEILKNSELKHFYDIYPEKFNNKTNGITFRRWLMSCNPELTRLFVDTIGADFLKDAKQLEKLMDYVDDQKVLDAIYEIKGQKKLALKKYLKETQGIEIDENSVFDIQIKRLHEYKRQQMNLLYMIYKYLQIKNGTKPATPMTFIFGAKAAPAYVIAKDIIHAILTLADIVNQDAEVNPYMKIVMVENYNVSKAEKLIPACDISEQISLASKEASGTGNMKFMLNGAVTLGTLDGANMEICELVGEDNIYIFGESSETVIDLYDKGTYNSGAIYKRDKLVHKVVDFLVSDVMLQTGRKENLERLHHELISKDWFMTLLDFKDYVATKDGMFDDFADKEQWKKMMLINMAKAGFFSSDRTIAEYNKDIWKLK